MQHNTSASVCFAFLSMFAQNLVFVDFFYTPPPIFHNDALVEQL